MLLGAILGTILLTAAFGFFMKIMFDEVGVFNQLSGFKLVAAIAFFPIAIFILSSNARKQFYKPLLLFIAAFLAVYLCAKLITI